MSVARKIAWEKFIPAYEESDLDNTVIDDQNDQDNSNFEEDEDNEEGIMNFVNIQDLISMRKIRTPFGYYDINDQFSPYNMFDCWIGHTNFRIRQSDFHILNKEIDGIGCLKVISPYRFFIGIERMFTFPSVRIQIQKELCNNLEFDQDISNTSDNNDIDNVISRLNEALFNIRDSNKWAVFVGKDGNIMTIKNSEFESDTDYQKELTTLKLLKNGNIITYDSL